MKKNHAYNILSDQGCQDCKRRLKLNVVERKPTAKLCYDCGRKKEESHGNYILSAKEVRTGKRKGRAKGIYRLAK